MGLQELLARTPVLSYEEITAYLDRETSGNRRTRDALLWHYVSHGNLLRVRKGLFVAVPVGFKPETVPVDPLLIAAKATQDAVLAYHTALEFHGTAYSVFHEFRFLNPRPLRPFRFRSYAFKCTLHPKALRDKGKTDSGVKTVDREGVACRVTTPERTLVDVLDRPEHAGGWEEIWRSLGSVRFFDLDKVVEYALLLANATTIAKVGYFLDQHRERLMVEDSHLKPLREHRPKEPHYIERRSRREPRLIRDWNIVVPADLADRTWEEPA